MTESSSRERSMLTISDSSSFLEVLSSVYGETVSAVLAHYYFTYYPVFHSAPSFASTSANEQEIAVLRVKVGRIERVGQRNLSAWYWRGSHQMGIETKGESSSVSLYKENELFRGYYARLGEIILVWCLMRKPGAQSCRSSLQDSSKPP